MKPTIEKLITQYFPNNYELKEEPFYVSFIIKIKVLNSFKHLQIGAFIAFFDALKNYELDHNFNTSASLIEIINEYEVRIHLAKNGFENIM